MIKRTLLFIILFLLTFYSFFLYDECLILILLILEPVLYLSGSILLWYLRRNLSVSIGNVLPVAEKNSPVTLSLRFDNHSPLPISQAEAILTAENSFTGEVMKSKVWASVPPHGTSVQKVSFISGQCGNVQLTITELYLFDYLHLMKERIVLKGAGRQSKLIGILPACHLIPVEITRKTREFLAESDEYSAKESGDDASEIFQIREYQMSDPLHSIHWKLSAKADELLVKEQARPLGPSVLIRLCLEGAKSSNYANLIEVVSSIALSLMEEECVHLVTWYEVENHHYFAKCIRKEEHVYELMNRLLYVKPYNVSSEIDALYEETFRGQYFSTIIELHLDGSIYLNNELWGEIPGFDHEVIWNQLLLQV